MTIFAALLFRLLTLAILTMWIPTSAAAARHGVWTRWDDWSPCHVTCGDGQRTRYRACFPIGGHCNGSAVERQPCKMKDCPGVGKWSKWTDWTVCSKSCGVGMQTQFRNCLSDQCIGSNRQARLCNTNACPVSGGWSAWNEWSSCSEPCGIGIRYQDRTCEDPAPAAGGGACKGVGTRVGHCLEKPCSDKSIQAGVFYGDSYLEYDKTYFTKKLLSLFVKFKPYERDGLLVYRHHGSNDTTARRNDTVVLRLDGAKLAVFLQYAGVQTWLQSDDILQVKKWHSVLLTIAGSRVVLTVDNGIPNETLFGNVQMEKVDLDQQMFVGALSETFSASTGINFPGFVGHIATIRVNYEEYFLDDVEEPSVNQETNHPMYRHSVDMTEMDSLDLYPSFVGSDYTVFTCFNCKGQPDFQVEVIVKPFDTSAGVIWSNFGQNPGSYVVLYLYESTLILAVNLGAGKAWTTTEPIAVGAWLTISVAIFSKQVKLRLNHERAYMLALEGDAFNASRAVHFAGGEANYWTLLYFATEQVKGFRGILYSMNINKKDHNVLREVATRETGRMVSSESSSIAARYDEFHEPPVSEVEFQCDLSAHEEKLGVSGGIAFWLRESEMIQNFTGIAIQKVAGMKHATKMTLRNREVGDKDGFYGCLLRTAHQEILVHVFGVSFDDANEIDYVDVGESVALVAAILGSLFAIAALALILRSGLLRRFPPYNALLRRLPSWMSPEDRKNLLLRHTDSLRRAGELPEDYLKELYNLQSKAVQVPSLTAMGAVSTRNPPLHDVEYRPYSAYNDPDSDYDTPVPAKKSDGTLFPQPLIPSRPRGPLNLMPIPPHIKKDPQKYLPKAYDSDRSEHLTRTTSYDTSTSQNTTTKQSSRKPKSNKTTTESDDSDSEDSFELKTISSTDREARTRAEKATYKRPRPKAARNVTPPRSKVKFNRKDRADDDEEEKVPRRVQKKKPHRPQRSYETFPFHNQNASAHRTPQPTPRRNSAYAVGRPYGPPSGLATPTGRGYAARPGQWTGPATQYAPTPVQPQVYAAPTQPADAYGLVGPGYAQNNLAYHQDWPPQQEDGYGQPVPEYEQTWTGQGADEQGLVYDEAGNAFYPPPPQEFAGYDAQGNQLFYQ